MRPITAALAGLLGALAAPGQAAAHCDTTRGPVVTSSRAALESGDVRLVLHWVRPEDEATIRSAFEHASKVRALGPEARELADGYFHETLVRVHRAGEGAPYTGLKDADPEPVIAATDRALESGDRRQLEQHLVEAVRHGLARRFAAARKARSFPPGDVDRGRAYVAAYVSLTHWVEGVAAASSGGGSHHEPAAQARSAEKAHGHVAQP